VKRSSLTPPPTDFASPKAPAHCYAVNPLGDPRSPLDISQFNKPVHELGRAANFKFVRYNAHFGAIVNYKSRLRPKPRN